MPRYGEKATLEAPTALAPFRWQHSTLTSIEDGEAVLLLQAAGDSAPRPQDGRSLAGWTTESTVADIVFAKTDARGALATQALLEAPLPITMRWTRGAEFYDFGFTGFDTVGGGGRDEDTNLLTGAHVAFQRITGRTLVGSAGAATTDWTDAAVTLRGAAPPPGTPLWFEVVDLGSIPVSADTALELDSSETATVETRWRPGSIAGRVVTWRSRAWTVIDQEEIDRRRTWRLQLKRYRTET